MQKKLQALVDSEDARIIECLPLSQNQLTNPEGWHFTKSILVIVVLSSFSSKIVSGLSPRFRPFLDRVIDSSVFTISLRNHLWYDAGFANQLCSQDNYGVKLTVIVLHD